jgi:hypothetical protein
MRTTHAETELATVGAAIRDAYVEAPPAEVAERHIAAMLAEAERIAAEALPPTAARLPRRRIPVFRLAAVVGASFIATAGLAVAGVRPPEPFSDLYEAVGFDIPGNDGGTQESGKGGDAGRGSGGPGSKPAGASVTGAEQGQQTSANQQDGKPGRRQGQQPGHSSEEGQETAEEARSGSTPPTDPGRSEDHPAPQPVGPDGNGAPGQSGTGAGAPDHSQGSSRSAAPAAPPGQARSRGATARGSRGGPPLHAAGIRAGG